jgi:signal peptidase I
MGTRKGEISLHRMMILARLLRYAVYASILGMLWWLFTTFSFVPLEEGDVSVVGVSGYYRVLVKRLSGSNEPVECGDVMVFAILDETRKQIFRISRVAGVPGDVIDIAGGFYTINGEKTDHAVSETRELVGTVPEGFYLMINDNPWSAFADSRRLGLIDRQVMVGWYLVEMPF